MDGSSESKYGFWPEQYILLNLWSFREVKYFPDLTPTKILRLLSFELPPHSKESTSTPTAPSPRKPKALWHNAVCESKCAVSASVLPKQSSLRMFVEWFAVPELWSGLRIQLARFS